MEETADRGHAAGDRAAHERRAASGLLAGVRKRLRPAHAHARAERGRRSPTSSAVCELDAIAAAKIGASEETVPSIIPTSAGLHDAQQKSRLVLEARAVDQPRDQRVAPPRRAASRVCVLIAPQHTPRSD